MKKMIFLQVILALMVSLLTACSDDSVTVFDNAPKGTARYTAIIFGHNGGDMEHSIEGTMRSIQTIIGDEEDVRVLLVYKYGGSVLFNGSYGYPGQLLFFEITKDTDFTKLKDSSAIVKDSVKFYDPDFISYVINYAHDSLPAQEYLLFLEAHGSGYDFLADFPKSERNKYNALTKQTTISALMFDNWDPIGGFGAEALTTEELARGIKKSKVPHFKAIFFNVCLMGNMESLSEIYPYSDYTFASAHTLYSSNGEMMPIVVDALTKDKNGDFADVIKATFESNAVSVPWKIHYLEEDYNGDIQFLRNDKFAGLNPIFKKLSDRLIELYADEKNRPAIDKAADKAYKVSNSLDLIDASDYANKLAEETQDKDLIEIAKELNEAFNAISVSRALEAHYAKDAPLDHFTLAVTLVDSATYNEDMVYFNKTNRDSYKTTTFHKETGWGNWLNVNTHKPEGNPYGQ